MTYIYPQDVIPKLSHELLLLFAGLLVHCTQGDIPVCTNVKTRQECTVFHILGHVCPAYMSVIFSYLSCLCGGEGICAIMFYNTSGCSQGYLCKKTVLHFYWFTSSRSAE